VIPSLALEDGLSLEEWQIRLILPHRPPVLQLDRVDRCAPDLSAVEATKAVGGSDPMLRRGPAGASLAPGALIEALAQCCGLLVRLRWLRETGVDVAAFADGDTDRVRSGAIPRSVLAESHARFVGEAQPGQVLSLTARLVLARNGMYRFNAAVRDAAVRGTADIMSADIMLKFPHQG